MEEIVIGYWYSKHHYIMIDKNYRLKLQVAEDLNVPYYSVQMAAKLLKTLGLKVNYPSLLAAVYFLNKDKLRYNFVLKVLKQKRKKGKKLFKNALAALKHSANVHQRRDYEQRYGHSESDHRHDELGPRAVELLRHQLVEQ